MERLKGFTLVELVIVIAIVIILSVVSVPIYRGYTKNAKMAEGYALLGTILSAQKAYYSHYGIFLNCGTSSAKAEHYTCNEEVLGIDARGNKYFTYFQIGASFNNDMTEMKYHFWAGARLPEELGYTNEGHLRLNYDITSGSTMFLY